MDGFKERRIYSVTRKSCCVTLFLAVTVVLLYYSVFVVYYTGTYGQDMMSRREREGGRERRREREGEREEEISDFILSE